MKTPQQPFHDFGQALGVSDLWLKREDMHPYGSQKGRSIPLMIQTYFKKQGLTRFVISSSGNAALASALTVKKHNQNNPHAKISLQIFVGQHIDVTKLKKLQTVITDEEYIALEQHTNPKQQAFQLDKQGQAKFLRQSTDDLALEGYAELAQELNKIPNLQAIFVPTSSGTTAQGLAQAFMLLNQKPQIHIVQTESCHPLAESFDTPRNIQETSLAGAIVDHVAHRKQQVHQQIQQSGGSGWIVNNQEIQHAKDITTQKANIDISFNSALSIAGLCKAIENGWKWNGAVVCLITGR